MPNPFNKPPVAMSARAAAPPVYRPTPPAAKPVAAAPSASGAVQGLIRARVRDPKTIQRKMPAGVEAFQVNLQPKAGGWPLPTEVRRKMEHAFGTDFSDVRVHVGPEASAIGAIAFTWGSSIHFAPGQYSPHTPQGQQLLGHELAHVVQQRSGRVRNPYGSGTAVVQDHALEAEADALGHRAARTQVPK